MIYGDVLKSRNGSGSFLEPTLKGAPSQT